jgi:hypothetical protein
MKKDDLVVFKVKERDKLRSYLDKLDDLTNSVEDSVEELRDGLDTLSQYL